MTALRHTVYLAFGSNLGDREAAIRQAYAMVETDIGAIDARSGFHRSKPWGFQSDNDFVNTVVRLTTTLTPLQLLDATQSIERRLGRTAKSSGGVYHDRTIDIDILYYDHLHLDTPRLTLPHPLISQRPFVLIPLQEITNT